MNTLLKRKSDLWIYDWVLDSGAFTALLKNGDHALSTAQYAEQIKRWKTCGNLLAAVCQDYMCEPFMLERTGLTIADHQRLTIERYDALLREDTGVYIMPVLQGYASEDYVQHGRMYGNRLEQGMWVGVGSVCKRNGNPKAIEEVLLAIKGERPDLQLHGFGLKKTALSSAIVLDLLHTADSMAWSFEARMNGRDANDVEEAKKWKKRMMSKPVQNVFPFEYLHDFGTTGLGRIT